MKKPSCFCDKRKDITCNDRQCDLAGPAFSNTKQCRVCYIWLQENQRIQTTPASINTVVKPKCPECPKTATMKKDIQVPVSKLVWSYGVTTIPERRDDLLPRTLNSLRKAGFDKPVLFVDGCQDAGEYRSQFGLEVTARWPRKKLAPNWILSANELYFSNPFSDRYVIFQDDIVVYKNLKSYLENSPYPAKGYCNLFTFPWNQDMAQGRKGWYETRQDGKGAVALVFDRETFKILLSSKHLYDRADNDSDGRMNGRLRGWRAIDGGIMESLRSHGIREYVHNPSLVQHVGQTSSINKSNRATGDEEDFTPYTWTDNLAAPSFKGENYDALQLLQVDTK